VKKERRFDHSLCNSYRWIKLSSSQVITDKEFRTRKVYTKRRIDNELYIKVEKTEKTRNTDIISRYETDV
jgi:hypothetical protein